jgi:hypothetical protein
VPLVAALNDEPAVGVRASVTSTMTAEAKFDEAVLKVIVVPDEPPATTPTQTS